MSIRNQDFTDLSEIESNLQTLNSLIPSQYDNGVATYVGDNMTKIVFKLGLVTVATIDFTYDGSGNMLTFVKS